MAPPPSSDRSHLPPDADHRKIDALATRLIEARTERRALGPMPDELVPVDAIEAQLVDDHVAAITGWPVLGWKVGCTSEHAQKLLGSPGPFAGRIYSVFEDRTTLTDDDLLTDPHIEGEFAFTLARPLAPGADGHARGTVLDAIAELRPAIELVGGRFANFVGTALPLLIADAGANTHLVLGPPADAPDLDALSGVVATMTIDGAVTGSGSGADVLGDPIEALLWLANHLSDRGIALEAGQMVTTGTATQVAPLPKGSTATASFDGIGTVSVSRR